MRHGNRFPREDVDALSLEVLKAKVGWGFDQLDLMKRVPAYGRGVETI